MKLMIPVKDIMVAPGERLNVSDSPDDMVIEKIWNAYGVIADVMNIHIQDGNGSHRVQGCQPGEVQ